MEKILIRAMTNYINKFKGKLNGYLHKYLFKSGYTDISNKSGRGFSKTASIDWFYTFQDFE